MPKIRRGAVIKNLLAVVLILALAEAALRLLEREPIADTASSLVTGRVFKEDRLPDGSAILHTLGANPRPGPRVASREEPAPFINAVEKGKGTATLRYEPAVFTAVKPPNVFRVFLIGSSPVWGGHPGMAETNLSTWLYKEIEPRFSGLRVEIINAAHQTMSGREVGAMIDETADYSPDVILVYLSGVFQPAILENLSRFNLLRSPWLFRALSYATRLRLLREGQRMIDQFSTTRGASEAEVLSHFDMAGKYDARLANLIANNNRIAVRQFDDMLNSYLRIIRRKHPPVIFLSAPVNLGDAPPLASIHYNPNPADLRNFALHFVRGVDLYGKGDFAAARPELEAAHALDPHYAKCSYLLGKCREAAGDATGAAQAYAEARDDDASSERIGAMLTGRLKDWCARNAMPLVELEPALAAATPRRVIGREVFSDQTHFTPLGLSVVARVVAKRFEDEGFFRH